MKLRTLTVAGLALSLVAVAALDTASARSRQRSKYARYQDSSLRDSLMASYNTPGVIILDREFVKVSRNGENAQAKIEREWLFFVREPDGMTDYDVLSFQECPGRDINELEVVKLDGKNEKKIKVEKSNRFDCDLYSKHKVWEAPAGPYETGDLVVVRMTYTLDGANPTFTHAFDAELPVVQSDVTFEVSRELFEGKVASGWHWWAGSTPRYVAWRNWEKPKSYRFRWGEANIDPLAPGQEPRVVASTWLLDPQVARNNKMVASELQAAGGGSDLTYHGPTISAQQLSGLDAAQRHEGERQSGQAEQADQALYGSLSWDAMAALVADRYLEDRMDASRKLTRMVDDIVDGAKSKDEVVARLTARVAEIETLDLPVCAGFNDLHRPEDVLKAGCATSFDKASLLTAMLLDKGINAYPVLLKEDRLTASLTSVEVFDEVGVIIQAQKGRQYVDVDTGRIHSTPPRQQWGAILTLPLKGSEKPQLKIGDDLTSLME